MGTGHTRRGRARRTVAFVAVGAVGLAATGATTAAGHDEPRAGLRIMLTNDDGWNAPGIIAVYDALVAEGHEVIMVAPLTNQSGVGGRITFGGAGPPSPSRRRASTWSPGRRPTPRSSGCRSCTPAPRLTW